MTQPEEEKPAQTFYDQLGGATVLEALVKRFYANMDTLPEAEPIRRMHPDQLSGSESKLFKFLSGWLGGPNLYIEEFGHPRLRMRHLPFAIGTAARDQWLLCMKKALDDTIDDPRLRQHLYNALDQSATHMINQPD